MAAQDVVGVVLRSAAGAHTDLAALDLVADTVSVHVAAADLEARTGPVVVADLARPGECY